jgi:hypothetical protein
MEERKTKEAWLALCERLAQCRLCHQQTPKLVDEKAFPLFGRFGGGRSSILFIAALPASAKNTTSRS